MVSEELMPHSSLLDSSVVKNIRVKVALGGVNNNRISQPNLHPLFAVRSNLLILQFHALPRGSWKHNA
jgi:hypothetical protein